MRAEACIPDQPIALSFCIVGLGAIEGRLPTGDPDIQAIGTGYWLLSSRYLCSAAEAFPARVEWWETRCFGIAIYEATP
jgi:hypothetical protein